MITAKFWPSIGWVATVLCAACSRSALPIPSPPSEAVAYQIDPAHTGAQPNDPVSPPLTLRWSVKLSGVVSYPIIAGGRVFVTAIAHRDGTYGTSLYALDQRTGATAWGPVDIPSRYSWSNAAYDAGRLFVVNNDGVLRSFDAATGDAAWSVQLPGQDDFSSPPTALNGTVYVGGAGCGGTVYAVDEATGAVIWTEDVLGGDNSSPAVSASGVYVSYACQYYDFGPANGAVIWHYGGGCEGAGGSTPVLFGGNMYVRDTTSNVVLDAQTGALVRSFDAALIPAFSGSQGFFLNGSILDLNIPEHTTLQAMDLTTWTPSWSFQGDGQLTSAPLVVGGNVYVGSTSGMLYAIDTGTGAKVWSTNVGSGIAAPVEFDRTQPLTGLAAAAGALIVPAGDTVVAYW
jgi:outer membrane protein assembly factor BamB